MIWRDAVIEALHRFSIRHSTRCIDRQSLIQEELEQISRSTSSVGETPSQTLSRVLQELRDEGILYFTENGKYFLADAPVYVESEDLPDDALDIAIQRNKLIFTDIPVGDELRMARQRKGQSRVRQVTLINYMNLCAFCDVNDRNLLIASHIARWADDQSGRGNLTNLICMCRFHDTLFEFGYFSLADDFSILRKGSSSKTITILLDRTMKFRDPNGFIPSPYYLNQHRRWHNY